MKYKKYILLIFILLAVIKLSAQKEIFYYKVLNKVDVLPLFPGGNDSLKDFIFDNYNLELLSAYSIKGYIYAKFTISKDGNIPNIKLVKGLDKFLDKEFLRVLSIMPKWTPAKISGKPVDCSVLIGIYLTTDF